jgi:hypothetical protein
MKETSIAILLLTIGMAASETRLSVDVEKTTSFIFFKSLNFKVKITSGHENSLVDISPKSYWYIFGGLFEKLSEEVYHIKTQINFKDTPENSNLSINQPQLDDESKDEKNAAINEIRVLELSKELGDEGKKLNRNEIISTKEIKEEKINCPNGGKLMAEIVNISFSESSFLIEIAADCKNDHPDTTKQQEDNNKKNEASIKQLDEEIEQLELKKKEIKAKIDCIRDKKENLKSHIVPDIQNGKLEKENDPDISEGVLKDEINENMRLATQLDELLISENLEYEQELKDIENEIRSKGITRGEISEKSLIIL